MESTITDEDVVVVGTDLEMICRICLLNHQDMKDPFHQDGDSPALSLKAMSFACVKITSGDGLPSQFCSNCSDKVEAAYKFKLQIEQADSFLRKKLDFIDNEEKFIINDDGLQSSNCENEKMVENSENKVVHRHEKKGETNQENRVMEIIKDDQSLIEDASQICSQQNQEIEASDQVQTDSKNYDLQQASNEPHIQSIDSQEFQEMMLSDMCDRTKNQEDLNQLSIDEHDYVAESSFIPDKSATLNFEETQKEFRDGLSLSYGQTETSNFKNSQNELAADSGESIQTQTLKVKHFNEENQFENLNLSSRLRKTKSPNFEKVFFMCYLCDKQFLCKEVLKEHMSSHDEVKQTLNYSNPNLEKLPKTPEKSETVEENPNKATSSGKQPNKCPHCGKEYLYIISYNKHLKQHEREKRCMKDQSMPLEVSFTEDDDALNFCNYENPAMTDPLSENEQNELFSCSHCKQEFDKKENLRNHCVHHVTESMLKQTGLENDSRKQGSWDVNKQGMVAEGTEKTNSLEFSKKDSVKDFKCPDCSMRFKDKKDFARHMECHSGIKYGCKFCPQSFSRKDHLRQHLVQHGNRHKSFKCVQCNKSFNNELTLRNHLIATNHKTTLHGEEYDPNRRIKRSAAKAAQKIIDQIRTDLKKDESEDEDLDTNDMDFVDIKEEYNDDYDDENENSSKKLHRTVKTLICETCDLKFSSKQALTKHMEQHVKDEDAMFQESDKIFEESDVQANNENGNNYDDDDDDNFEGGLGWPTESHECPTCKKKYTTKKSLLRHQLLHEEPNFECDICNVKFYRKDKLKAHYDKCSEKNPDQVRKCNICGDTFENNEILKEHRAKHVTEGVLTEEDLREIEPGLEDKVSEKVPRKKRTDIVGLECTECNKQYTSRKGLLRHIQVHEGKKYLCDICPKKFFRREHLKIHVAKHNITKPYKCSRCPKRFIKEELLNTHVLKHERTFRKPKETDTVKRFLCEICSKSFTQSTTLIAHLRAHKGIKPYTCEVCSRPFTTNAYLKMHMRTHTQERPYICQYCSRAFARADTLANHLTSHTGEAKYHCKYCPKHFRRLKSLKEHVFIHTGQKPYACPTCDRKFNNNGSRYAHSKRCKQSLQGQAIIIQQVSTEQNLQEIPDHVMVEEESDAIQIQHQQLEIQNQLQQQRISLSTTSQAQIVKPQNIKTITITRPDGALNQHHIMAQQEILMPLLLPVTVTLADVGEDVILSEGTKIFTT